MHRHASGARFLRYSFAFTIEEDSRLANFLSQKPIWFFPTDESLLTNVKTILHETGQSTSFSLPIIQGRMLEIFHSITKVLQYASYKEDLFEGNTDSRVSIAKVYIRMNANKNLSCSEVAHECGISGKHLNRLFLKYTNQSLHSYIIQTRIKKAEELLLNPDLTIKEISMMMGFESEYYFRNFFKRHRGIPPALFRKNYAK